MEPKLPDGSPNQWLMATVRVNGREIGLWNLEAKLQNLGDPRSFAVQFPDDEVLRGDLTRLILEESGLPWLGTSAKALSRRGTRKRCLSGLRGGLDAPKPE